MLRPSLALVTSLQYVVRTSAPSLSQPSAELRLEAWLKPMALGTVFLPKLYPCDLAGNWMVPFSPGSLPVHGHCPGSVLFL